MKTIIFLLICFSVATVYSQTFSVRMTDQYSAFRTCRALPEGVMLAAGECGRMIRSTDAGEHWRNIEVGSFANFTRMDFSDSRNGVMADDSGRVWQTTDAGATWSIAANLGEPLPGITYAGGNTVIVAGSAGNVWRGDLVTRKWSKLSHGLDSVELIDIAFSGLRGIVVGLWGDIALTTDGGNSWSKYRFTENSKYHRCKFLGESICIVTSADTTLGQTDLAFCYNFETSVWDTVVKNKYDLFRDFTAGKDNEFITVSTNKILHSNDFGKSWENTADTVVFERTPGGYQLIDIIYSISILPDGSGLAVGGYISGGLATTNDYGKSWKVRCQGSSSSMTTGFLAFGGLAYNGSSDTIYVAGGFRKRIYRSTDAGATWMLQYPLDGYELSYFSNIHFVSRTTGYVVGTTGLSSRCFAKTTDAGATWNDVEQVGNLFNFPEPSHGYMSHFRSTEKETIPIFFRSVDSGATWQPKYFKDLIKTLPVKDTVGWRSFGVPQFATAAVGATLLSIGGRTTFVRANDYGETWNFVYTFDSTETPDRIVWKNKNTVFVYSLLGKILLSEDGGNTWLSIESGLTSLTALTFLTDSVGLIAGFDGTAALTLNGGKTWSKLSTPASVTLYEKNINVSGENYREIFRVNDSTAYLIGVRRVRRVVISTEKSTAVTEESIAISNMLISPNPASDFFTVHCPEGATITVRDVFGRIKTINDKVVAGKAIISTDGFTSGIYFVEIHDLNGRRNVGKVAINR
ncbi:MAG: T9SS type A sorting domain-containing protein [Bacteroidetes bacterium]|jgi:photosystem II stability/assembly factor-like uncharacterized protein|nr:T9SS type A sorting domain-containing protein [Bacteroidota bacterium]MCZ2132843.1 T9SS type A sorting domain-containing protein [Bacteroidota bacterium]